MTRDWKQIARASALPLPEAELDGIVRTLAALEAAFRPLAASLPPDLEPALNFQAAPEDAE